MSSARLFRTICFLVAGTVAVVCIVDAAGREDAVSLSGKVTASCVTLRERPLPEVYTISGTKLAGDAWLSSSLGAGPCVSLFTIDNVPRQPAYQVHIGTISAIVSQVESIGNVELTDM